MDLYGDWRNLRAQVWSGEGEGHQEDIPRLGEQSPGDWSDVSGAQGELMGAEGEGVRDRYRDRYR